MNKLVVERRTAVPMRDGTSLTATVYRTDAPRPVLLVRNPYGEPMTRSIPVAPFTDAGFAVVVQDCRGCGDADGDFVPFENERADSVDTIDWCAAQDWSSGEVVTYGASYSGMVQLDAASQAPPALRGMIPIVTPADYLTGVAYRSGAFQLGQLTGWYTLKSLQTLQVRARRGEDVAAGFAALGRHGANPLSTMRHVPLSSAPFVSQILPTWTRWLDRPRRDEYWKQLSYRDRRMQIAVPALHIGGWFDLFLGGTLENFRTLRAHAATAAARAGQRLIIGPWSHIDQSGAVGELAFGPAGSSQALGLEAMETAFARAALSGDEVPGPAVRVFVMGANRWREAEDWPLPDTHWTPWYLHEGAALSPVSSTEATSTTAFAFDPEDPTPTVGGQTLMTGGTAGGNEWAPGPRDQRAVEARGDVVSFTTAPLAEDVEVVGPVQATVHVSVDSADADVIVRLVDVWPDGRAMSVTSGITRLSFRAGQDLPPEPATPGVVYEVDVDLWGTAQLFRAGHCIRVDIAGGSFPEFDRSTPTATAVVHTVHHDRDHPSRVVLPVVGEPDESA